MIETYSTMPTFIDIWVCSWLGWIVVETSFLEGLRSVKLEFKVKSYCIFREVTYTTIFECCGSVI